MPDMDKVIKDLEEVREYIARKGHDLASRKCRMMDKVTDALAMLKEQEAVVRCKDCQRRGTYDCPVYVGSDGMCSEPDEWFCADGERRPAP